MSVIGWLNLSFWMAHKSSLNVHKFITENNPYISSWLNIFYFILQSINLLKCNVYEKYSTVYCTYMYQYFRNLLFKTNIV